MPMPALITSTLEPNTKSQKDCDNELLEKFFEMFAKHFYENCTMSLKILGGRDEIYETFEDLHIHCSVC